LVFNIPSDKISEVINRADILDVISPVVVLKKKGKEYLGLCPFHSEKTPSFTVNPVKQVFYCHGCHEGGNVFSFIMKQNSISFPEAVNLLAKRYGIEIIPREMTPEQKKRLSERENLISINKAAMAFFQKCLFSKNNKQGALEYLYNRKIAKEIIVKFNLGYAPAGWNNLVNHFSREKFSLPLVEKSGLIVSNKNGFYDRFRDRIVFPIFDLTNQVIGFGGRVMDTSLPKYLNSPETPLYNKSRSVFGIDKAKNECRKTSIVYIVEGYFDLIALHQHGFYNSVATLGTALTREHARLLKGFIGENGTIILVYDSDEAGLRAAKRSIDIFNKEHVNAKILILPSGHDPDSYLFEFGGEAFENIVKKGLPTISFLIESEIKKYGLSLEGKVKIIAKISKLLGAVNDNVLRSLYIKELSERVEVDESAIMEKIRSIISKNSQADRVNFYPASAEPLNMRQPDFFPEGETGPSRKNLRVERHIVAMMLRFPEVLPKIEERNVLEYFNDTSLKLLGKNILEHSSGKKNEPVEILSRLHDHKQKNLLASLAVGDETLEIKKFNRFIARFIEAEKKCKETSLLKKIKSAEESNDEELLLKSLNEANLRLKTLKGIQKKVVEKRRFNV